MVMVLLLLGWGGKEMRMAIVVDFIAREVEMRCS